MMEDLEANVSNIATSNYSGDAATELNNQCSINNPQAKHEKHLRRWCLNLDSGLKTMKTNDVRNIHVRTLTKNNRNMKIITFQICSNGTNCSGGAKKYLEK